MKKRIIVLMLIFINMIVLDAKGLREDTESKDVNTFKIVNGGEPASLDPVLIQASEEDRIYTALFEGLLSYNYVTARTIPGIAKSVDISDDKTVYTFYLRKTSWSDGTPITSQTFIDSWERLLNPKTDAPYAFFMGMFVKGAEDYHDGIVSFNKVGVMAIDDYTLQVTLLGPLPYGQAAFAHPSFSATPTHVIKKFGKNWTNINNIVTNGPFILKERSHLDRIVVEKNPNYWDAENVKLNKIIFYAIEDENMGYRMFMNDEVDWTPFIPKQIIARAKFTKNIHFNSVLSTYYYILNSKVKPLNDVRVRKALSLAIDRTRLVKEVTKAGQIPATAMIPYMYGYPSVSGEFLNIEKANKLLAHAGYSNGKGFPELPLLYNSDEQNRRIAEFIKSQWEENLGIKVVLQERGWDTWLANITSQDFAIAKVEWTGDYQDPNTFLDMFITDAEMNFIKYSNPEYDALVKKASTMAEGNDRAKTFMAADTILSIEDQALIPLYFGVQANGIDTDDWGGWAPNVLDIHPLKTIYKKEFNYE